MKKTRVDLLFGFLGSGKTTLARRILNEYGAKRRLALIVNEFGDVGVDGEILKGKNIDIVQLTSGCLCCSLKGSLEAAIIEIGTRSDVDHIVVEATGVAEPETLLDTFAHPEFRRSVEIGPVVTVVDTPKFIKIRTMLGPFYEAQIEKADFVILNKIDRASAELIDEVMEEVRELNPDAIIRPAEQCDVDLLEVLDGPTSGVLERWSRVHAHQEAAHDRHGDAHDHDHDHDHDHGRHAPAESFVIDVPEGIELGAIEELYRDAPEGLWRSKGFIRTADGQDRLVQVVMGDVEITPTEKRDRHYLVFIGDGLDAVWFRSRLEGASIRQPA